MTVNQNSIALSSDRGSLEIAGVSLLYEGTRVKSYLLGRDLNPAGRGLGDYYPQGMFGAGGLRPVCTPNFIAGYGNSINNIIGNCCCPQTGCVAHCPAGYRPEGCNCCLDTDDALERCVSLCKSIAPIKVVTYCGIPDFTYRLNHKSELQKDMYYRHAFCLYMAANAACADLNCGNDKITGWTCCMGYCAQVLFGGGGGAGGSGGGYGGSGGGGAGCGGCASGDGEGGCSPSGPGCCWISACASQSESTSAVRVQCNWDMSPHIIQLASHKILRCLECWIKALDEGIIRDDQLPCYDDANPLSRLRRMHIQSIINWLGNNNIVRCLSINKVLYGYPGDGLFCFGQKACKGCDSGNPFAIACGWNKWATPGCFPLENPYIMICNTFPTLPFQNYAWCSPSVFLTHELIHFATGWSHPPGNQPPNQGDFNMLSIALIRCCYDQECFTSPH